jgi:hypothetical protein
MPISQSFVDSLGEHGDKTALLALRKTGSEHWSYRELAECVHAFAQGLIRAALEPGDSVALFAENCREWIAAALGEPCHTQELTREGRGQRAHEKITNALQERVAALMYCRGNPRCGRLLSND